MRRSFKEVSVKLKKIYLKDVRKILPQRKKADHKRSVGSALIVAGSSGMMGAAVLTARAAARSGCGYVVLLTEANKFPLSKHPDFLLQDRRKSKNLPIHFDAIAIGPGMGTAKDSAKILKKLLKYQDIPKVLDADALTLMALEKTSKKELGPKIVLTPHEGEMSRLLGISAQRVRNNRIKSVVECQKKYGGVVLLKGNGTLICDAKQVYQISTGNPSLAKAGTGDVLSGMITAFLAQGLSLLQASCLAAYVHGAIADHWLSSKKDVLSLTASDLVEALPTQFHLLRKKDKSDNLIDSFRRKD